MAVRKAIVLAAGFGSRLRPLTLSRPKPLLPVMGEPMLARILDMLVSWGVEEIAINAHHLAGQIEDFAKEYSGGDSARGVKISVAREERILGTGGVLKPLASWIGDDPFWLVNGDIVVEDVDPEPIEDAFGRSGRFAACWMSQDFGPRTVEADPEGRICNWRSDDAGFPGTYTYCGVALLSSQVLGYLPDVEFSSIVEAYEKAMMADAKFVVGVEEPEACWCDAGTLDVYRELNSEPMAPSLFGEKRLDAVVSALGWKDGETLAEYLGARGSDRMFWKLMHGRPETEAPGTEFGGECALAVVYERARAENANQRFVPLTRFLAANGIPVPRILAELPDANAYATEFVEGKSLEELANAGKADFIKLYRPALELLGRLRALPLADAPELEMPFGEELYRWERGLFEDECVRKRFGLEGIPEAAAKELEGVAQALAGSKPVAVHRDFQSSNLICAGDGGMFVIDYQGLRAGPAEYDVASLLFDPYVPMSATDRKLLLELSGLDPRMVSLAAVQRLCQAAGAFCRLAAAGQSRFSQFIPRALENLHQAAHGAALAEFSAFTHRLGECLRGIRGT